MPSSVPRRLIHLDIKEQLSVFRENVNVNASEIAKIIDVYFKHSLQCFFFFNHFTRIMCNGGVCAHLSLNKIKIKGSTFDLILFV